MQRMRNGVNERGGIASAKGVGKMAGEVVITNCTK